MNLKEVLYSYNNLLFDYACDEVLYMNSLSVYACEEVLYMIFLSVYELRGSTVHYPFVFVWIDKKYCTWSPCFCINWEEVLYKNLLFEYAWVDVLYSDESPC